MSVEYQCFWLPFFRVFVFISFNPKPRHMRSWSLVLFLLVSLKLLPEVGERWASPDQMPGLPVDIGQLCLTSVAVINQAPCGKGLEAGGPGLPEVPCGNRCGDMGVWLQIPLRFASGFYN